MPPMADHEAALWREEMADPVPPVKRKPPRRIARPRNLTLTPAASAMLDALMARAGGDNASAEASAAILARGEAMGLRVALVPQGSG